MKFIVHLLAFCSAAIIREVDVPAAEISDDTNLNLSRVLHYGKNSVQMVDQLPSVSTGDVIELDSRLNLVLPDGFDEMHPDVFRHYRLMDCPTRMMYVTQRHKKLREERRAS